MDSDIASTSASYGDAQVRGPKKVHSQCSGHRFVNQLEPMHLSAPPGVPPMGLRTRDRSLDRRPFSSPRAAASAGRF